MQQRQLRLGDILDDYCPRERRVTNHAVVAMVGADVKQTRCSTCDTEHEYKHAKIPRQRKKSETAAALTAQISAAAPKRIAHESPLSDDQPPQVPEVQEDGTAPVVEEPSPEAVVPAAAASEPVADEAPTGPSEADRQDEDDNEGPVHRPLIRATLPRPEGQPPPARPAPEFTIR